MILRAGTAVVLVGVLCGCGLFAPERPSAPGGDIWIDVTNRSSDSVRVGWRGQSGGSESAAEGEVGACEAIRMSGSKEARWEILVDGVVIVRSDDLPRDVAAGDADLVVTVEIGPDGEVTPWEGEPLGPQGRGVGVAGCAPEP